MDHLSRARAYLAKLPPAISGSGGSGATFHAACILVQGFALDAQDAFVLLREYNSRCVPPWSESELVHKITDAMRKANPSRPRGYLLGTGLQAAARCIKGAQPASTTQYRHIRSSKSSLPPAPPEGVEVIWKLKKKVPDLEAGKQAITPVASVPLEVPPPGLKLTPAERGMLAAVDMDQDPLILTALRIFDGNPISVDRVGPSTGKSESGCDAKPVKSPLRTVVPD